MSDVPRPLKAVMPGYSETETALLNLIYEKYLGSSLTDEETAYLKGIDNDFLWYDLTYLLDDRPDGKAPTVHITPDYTVQPLLTSRKNTCLVPPLCPIDFERRIIR